MLKSQNEYLHYENTKLTLKSTSNAKRQNKNKPPDILNLFHSLTAQASSNDIFQNHILYLNCVPLANIKEIVK